jgi:acyl dehydratase
VTGPPFFEDLPVGRRFTDAPALTLTEGHAALHQAICGDRLPLALDRTVGTAVLGVGPPLAHPALVWDVAIGQSTVATGRVIANLFYRGLLVRRPVRLGDTLRTTTEVVARRENRSRPTGLAVLRIRTVDRGGATVTWSGGGSASYVEFTGSSALADAFFTCRAAVSPGQFTIPASVLLAVPRDGFILTVSAVSQEIAFPPGLDFFETQGIISFSADVR